MPSITLKINVTQKQNTSITNLTFLMLMSICSFPIVRKMTDQLYALKKRYTCLIASAERIIPQSWNKKDIRAIREIFMQMCQYLTSYWPMYATCAFLWTLRHKTF